MARRKHRRNPIVLGANPRRKRRTHRRNPVILGSNPYRRHRRHNPALSLKAINLPEWKSIAWIGVGAIATGTIVSRLMPFLPAFAQNRIGRLAGRVAIVAALGFGAKKLLKGNAQMFIYGAVANQVVPVANDLLSFVGIKLGDIGLSQDEEDVPVEMYYEPQAVIEGPEQSTAGMGMYYENQVEIG